jgi:hypothetical protein
LALDRLLNLFLVVLQKRVSPEQWEDIAEVLKPPNRIDPLTNLPYGWNEEDELDGLDAMLTG